MDSRQQFVVHEHRPHGKASPSYALIDRSAPEGQQHIATIIGRGEAAAIVRVLNKNGDQYAAALNEADGLAGDPFAWERQA